MNLDRKRKLKSLFISNRGSSSVLVILIMVMLVVLGLLALMSTWSELKLARKNAAWSTAYYSLDSEAEIRLAEISSCLQDADISTNNYIMTKDYERPESAYLPTALQQSMHNGWQAAQSSGEEADFIDSLYEKLYYAYSIIKLNELTTFEFQITSELDYDEDTQVFFTSTSLPENDAVKIFTTVHKDMSKNSRSLMLGIALQPASSESEKATERYHIVSWKEIPRQFEYEDELDFEEIEFGEVEFGEVEFGEVEFGEVEFGEVEFGEAE